MKREVVIKALTVVLLAVVVLSTAGFFWSEGQNNEKIKVGAICYHKFFTEQEEKNNGGMDTYAVWVEEFEAHLKYLKEQNIRAITASELLDYMEGKIDLPEKCILLTVDDCNITFYKYAYPLLKEYGVKMNAAVIGNRADWATEGTTYREHYCTWEEIAEMSASGYVEFGSHTYGLHDQADGRKGTMIKEGESLDAYRNTLVEDSRLINKKLEACVGYAPSFFVYPYYAVSAESVSILQKDAGYSLLFCGNSESAEWYLGDQIHSTNYNRFTKGKEPANRLIKRYTPRSGDDFAALIEQIFE